MPQVPMVEPHIVPTPCHLVVVTFDQTQPSCAMPTCPLPSPPPHPAPCATYRPTGSRTGPTHTPPGPHPLAHCRFLPIWPSLPSPFFPHPWPFPPPHTHTHITPLPHTQCLAVGWFTHRSFTLRVCGYHPTRYLTFPRFTVLRFPRMVCRHRSYPPRGSHFVGCCIYVVPFTRPHGYYGLRLITAVGWLVGWIHHRTYLPYIALHACCHPYGFVPMRVLRYPTLFPLPVTPHIGLQFTSVGRFVPRCYPVTYILFCIVVPRYTFIWLLVYITVVLFFRC